MTTSINQPWAISEKFRKRYGAVWSEIDFVFQPKISEDNFRSEPMSTLIGQIHCAGQQINMTYRDLLANSKTIEVLSVNLYSERVNKSETFEVNIKGSRFMLNCTEIGRLSDTLKEAANSAMRAYELGLYL